MAPKHPHLAPLCRAGLLTAAFIHLSAQVALSDPTPSEAQLKSLKARSIGPAIMGGRISDIALDPKNPHLFYVGLATGGIVKTANDGITFEPIFAKEPMLSIGALAIAPSNSEVLWVGTGEANDRNSSGWGNGVYRSTDGGGKWQHTGLDNTRAINRVVVDPRNADVAYVAAVGDLWVETPERGLFKTEDGGKTWKNILQAPKPHDTQAGCGDVAIDPANPDTIYAALYARRRTPWSFTYGPAASGGDDVGGIFKSTDGGATWKKLAEGLPTGTGRIGLAVSASKPGVVMAIVQSDTNGPADFLNIHSLAGGVFRSEDAGEHWTRQNDIDPRPFYFSQIRIDPANDQRVYVLGMAMLASDDGGKNFREDLFEKVHPDCHALVIQPGSVPPPPMPKAGDKEDRPKLPVSARLLLGTDGGVYQSFQAGENWDHVSRFACGQYYRVTTDDSQPFYRVAGGLQDNSNFVGPEATNTKDGIVNQDWVGLTGADGFYTAFDPQDKEVVYAEAQEGIVFRVNLRTGEGKELHPAPAEGQARYRFGWNTPFFASVHHEGTFYQGGNRVFKLTDKGEHSAVISPDLTKDEPTKTTAVGSGAENYGVIYSLAESPCKADLLWAGTDDGRLWVTENEGGQWTELTDNVPAPAHGQWVQRLVPSAKDPNVAYAVFSAYRLGDDAPMIYRTSDLGKTWQSVVGEGLLKDAPVQVVCEDPENPRLLYAGTEAGLFTSFDQGGRWVKVGGLPAVEVDDLNLQARTGDLVIATHGLSLFILDDSRPLRELTPEVMDEPAHLFGVRPVESAYRLPGFSDWDGKGSYHGENPAEGALFTVWIKEFTGDEIKLKVTNSQGQTVANLKAPGAPGLNRFNWDLRPTPDVLVKYGGDDAKKLVPTGDYTVEFSYGDTHGKQTFHASVAQGIVARSADDDLQQ